MGDKNYYGKEERCEFWWVEKIITEEEESSEFWWVMKIA